MQKAAESAKTEEEKYPDSSLEYLGAILNAFLCVCVWGASNLHWFCCAELHFGYSPFGRSDCAVYLF